MRPPRAWCSAARAVRAVRRGNLRQIVARGCDVRMNEPAGLLGVAQAPDLEQRGMFAHRAFDAAVGAQVGLHVTLCEGVEFTDYLVPQAMRVTKNPFYLRDALRNLAPRIPRKGGRPTDDTDGTDKRQKRRSRRIAYE